MLTTLTALTALVAFQGSPDAPTAEFKAAKPTFAIGKPIVGTLKLTFAPGMHGYQNPPSDEFEIPVKISVTGLAVLKVAYPKGKPVTTAGNEKPSMVYSGTIEIPVTFKPVAKAGKNPVTVKVDYQQCNDSNCWPPSSLTVKSEIVVK